LVNCRLQRAGVELDAIAHGAELSHGTARWVLTVISGETWSGQRQQAARTEQLTQKPPPGRASFT